VNVVGKEMIVQSNSFTKENKRKRLTEVTNLFTCMLFTTMINTCRLSTMID